MGKSSFATLRYASHICSLLYLVILCLQLHSAFQFERVLKHKVDDLVGANIKDIMLPESSNAIRRLLHDLVNAERVVRREEGVTTDSASVDLVSSDQSFSVREVNFNGQENMSDSWGDPSGKKDTRQTKVSFGKPCSRSVTAGATDDNSEPSPKKNKTTWASSSDSKTSSSNGNVDPGMNVDDVMGASVTANNAGAKLSSLVHKKRAANNTDAELPPVINGKGVDRKPSAEGIQPHIHRKHGLAPAPQKQDSRSSSSSTESDGRTRTGINSSEDSGYMDSNSAGSSDESPEDSSDSFWKKG